MPELPEVETVRTVLEKELTNAFIDNIIIRYPKIIVNVDGDTFINELRGEKFRLFLRRGKFLVIVFEKHTLLVHLRMEGKFYIKKTSEEFDKHEHIIFELKDGRSVRYHDVRKFGKMHLLSTTNEQEIMDYPELKKLGPDANSGINPITFFNSCLTYRGPIKQLLLDQKYVAGIGNIYANEICFKSRIHPLTAAKELTTSEVRSLILAMNEIIDQAIKDGGTTIKSYTSSLGVTGRFQQHLMVQSREGKPCKVCGTPIERVKLDGRSTFFCPKCQIRKYDLCIIGLTGPMGSGKTTVTNILRELNYKVIDCDEINRYLLSDKYPNSNELIEQLTNLYPGCVVDGEFNRRALRDAILEEGVLKREVEKIVHPLVFDEVNKKIQKIKEKQTSDEVIFLSAPLLVETPLIDKVKKVLYVRTDPGVLKNRLMARDQISDEEAEFILDNDATVQNLFKINQKNKRCVFIDNSYDIIYLKGEVKAALRKIGG